MSLTAGSRLGAYEIIADWFDELRRRAPTKK